MRGRKISRVLYQLSYACKNFQNDFLFWVYGSTVLAGAARICFPHLLSYSYLSKVLVATRPGSLVHKKGLSPARGLCSRLSYHLWLNIAFTKSKCSYEFYTTYLSAQTARTICSFPSILLLVMVDPAGIEPATSSLQG